MTDADRTEPRHHLMIAGTGRAGTSLLVRWLAAMGLETHLRVHTEPSWHDDANAGLEDLPLENDRETAPYVVKSPWLSEVIDAVLADPRVAIDGVIIPCRRPRQAQRSQQRASRPIVYGHFRDHTEAGAYACRLPARVPPDKGSATMTI